MLASIPLAETLGPVRALVTFIYPRVLQLDMLKFKCRDVGFDCGFETKGKTEDDIMQACAAHAQKDHGMKPSDINEDLKNKIRTNIHKSWF